VVDLRQLRENLGDLLKVVRAEMQDFQVWQTADITDLSEAILRSPEFPQLRHALQPVQILQAVLPDLQDLQRRVPSKVLKRRNFILLEVQVAQSRHLDRDQLPDPVCLEVDLLQVGEHAVLGEEVDFLNLVLGGVQGQQVRDVAKN